MAWKARKAFQAFFIVRQRFAMSIVKLNYWDYCKYSSFVRYCSFIRGNRIRRHKMRCEDDGKLRIIGASNFRGYPDRLRGSVYCGRCGKHLGIPEVNGFTLSKQIADCAKNTGWRFTRKYGWICTRCAEKRNRRRRICTRCIKRRKARA